MASGEKGDPATLADRALSLATTFLEGATEEIVDLSGGDLGALFEASQILRQRSTSPAAAHSAEHLAFSLITAAHTSLRTEGDETGQV